MTQMPERLLLIQRISIHTPMTAMTTARSPLPFLVIFQSTSPMTAMTPALFCWPDVYQISIHTPMTAILPKNHSLFLFKPNKPAPSIFRFVPSSPSLTLFFSLYLCTFPVRIPQAKTTCFRFAPFIFCNTLSFLPAILPSTPLDTGTSSTPS